MNEIMWKKMIEPDRPRMTIWRIRIACWIPKATNTHSEYVTLIAFPLQQWLLERSLLLPSTSIAWLVNLYNVQERFPLSKGAGYVLCCVCGFATLRKSRQWVLLRGGSVRRPYVRMKRAECVFSFRIAN